MKGGITYFPLNVELDDKIELIEAEFGLTGFAVIIKLFQKIYGENGYFCLMTEEVVLLFSRKIGLGRNTVSEIISAAIRRGIFDETLYKKYQILTSRGIQKRYFEAVSRRKNVEVKKEYLLLDACKIPSNVDILAENVNILNKNVDISRQRKEKERKEKERNISTDVRKSFVPPSLQEIEFYCKEKNLKINPLNFYNYFIEGNWVDSKGQKVRNWKQKLLIWDRFAKANVDDTNATNKTADELLQGLKTLDLNEIV